MSIVSELFTEKFRPKNINQAILLPRIRKEVRNGIVQNILLHSGPGMGKTSLAWILVNPCSYIYINASDEGGINTVREKISKFCATVSLDGNKDKPKVVFLEETDKASDAFWDSMRALIERYAHNVRFVGTCNYFNKIPENIKSRFNCISFDPINKEEEDYLIEEYSKRIKLILDAAKIKCSNEILEKLIKNDFPDMRSILNKIHSFYLQGITELNEKNFNINFDCLDLLEICFNGTSKPWETYKLIVGEYSTRPEDALTILNKDLPKFLKDNHPDKIDKIPLIIIALGNWLYKINFVSDKVSIVNAAIFELQMILEK